MFRGNRKRWNHAPFRCRRQGFADRSGFTLIEMLVVIGILGILFGLLMIPLSASFGFLGNESGQITLQNTAKDAMRSIKGNITDAMQVTTFSDNSTRIDLQMPASAIINQWGGVASPTIGSGAEPGNMNVTYFVGLMDPTHPYNNIYVSTGSNASQIAKNIQWPDNEYILWRAVYDLQDPNDPVGKAQAQRITANGNNASLSNDPWFFDDSLSNRPASGSITPPAQMAVSASGAGLVSKQALLLAMRNYTARLVNGTPVAAELTPVAVLGHLDAVRSQWVDGTAGNLSSAGWSSIDPLIDFAPASSQNEVLTPSEFGTLYSSSSGQWATTGSNAFNGAVYWGFDWTHLYQVNGVTINGGVVGPDGNPMNIQVINGPQAGQVYTGTVVGLMPYFIDPRMGRITFTQFQVTEVIPVLSSTGSPGHPYSTVYQLAFPAGFDLYGSPGGTTPTQTQAELVDSNGTPIEPIWPQVLPYSDSLVVHTVDPVGGTSDTPYNRQEGYPLTINPSDALNPSDASNAKDAWKASQGVSGVGPGSYIINYTSSPNILGVPGAYQPYDPSTEVPLVEIPIGRPNPDSTAGATDPNIIPWNGTTGTGTLLKLTYRFTFATLDAYDKPLPQAVATYSTQHYIHIAMGFRRYNSTGHSHDDYTLGSDVASLNRVDE